MRELVVGTRNSKLALIQTNWVIDRLRKLVDNPINVKKIMTKGDKRLDVSLPALGGGGVFLQELEAELLQDKIDFAIHSLKDIPVILPKLRFSSVPEREDLRDAYLANDHISLQGCQLAVLSEQTNKKGSTVIKSNQDQILKTKWIRGPIDFRDRTNAAR